MKYIYIIVFFTSLVCELKGSECIAQKMVVKDTIVESKNIFNFKKNEPHSPHKATIMALLLPGSGQIYNDQWWKVPILYGGLAADIYGIIWNDRNYNLYMDSYSEWVDYRAVLNEAKAQNPDIAQEQIEALYPDNPRWDEIQKSFDVKTDEYMQTEAGREWFEKILSNRRTSFKRNRDLCYILLGAIYALNVIDACVFAHFYDFEIDDDLSVNLQPQAGFTPYSGATVGMALTINF